MREQEVWFIGGPWDVCHFVPYPLPDKINVPFATTEFFIELVYERVGLDVYVSL
jgi:hypothetical protein